MALEPQGFRFAAVEGGLKYHGRMDMALIVSDVPAVTAGVFTTNIFKAAPVLHCQQTLARTPLHRAILINAGSANACTGETGTHNCKQTRELIAKAIDVSEEDILTASTGVIGLQFDMEKWQEAGPRLGKALGSSSPDDVAKAIMTTDTVPKIARRTVSLSGGDIQLLGLCKGAGMICPNMATLLAFVCCDAAVDPEHWQAIFAYCADNSFNRISIDGDTSTNDTFIGMANGASGVQATTEDDLRILCDELLKLSQDLAYQIVQDAEGGTKVARIQVRGAADDVDAELVARAIANSPLVKTALFGCDANWGRIMCAAGYSGAEFNAESVVLEIGGIRVFEHGMPVAKDLDTLLAPIMAEQEVVIAVDLGAGSARADLLASDLTKEYVEINADYRS